MSFYTDVRDAIYEAIVEADPDCPTTNIHKRFRDPRNLTKKKIEELFGSSDDHGNILHGYMYTRTGPSNEQQTAGNAGQDILTRTYTWKVKGFYLFRDEEEPTEDTFQELVDALQDGFHSNEDIQALRTTHDTYLLEAAVDYSGLAWDLDTLTHTIDITLRFERRGFLP